MRLERKPNREIAVQINPGIESTDMNDQQYQQEVVDLGSALKKYDSNLSSKSHGSHGVCTTFEFNKYCVVLNQDLDPWEKRYGFWKKSITDHDDWRDRIDWFDTRDELISLIESKM